MNVIDRLLGKKPKTAKNIAAEIASQEAAVVASRETRLAATLARKAAIDAADDEAHKAADEAIAACARNLIHCENAIEALRAEHAVRVEVEKREDHRREVAEAAADAKAQEERFMREYEPAALMIAGLANTAAAIDYRKTRLTKQARELGEPAPSYSVAYTSLAFVIGDLPIAKGKPGFLHQSFAARIAFANGGAK